MEYAKGYRCGYREGRWKSIGSSLRRYRPFILHTLVTGLIAGFLLGCWIWER